MTKYLLSSGGSTTNVVTYIRDILLLELNVPKDSIPLYTYGSERIVSEIRYDRVEEVIKSNLNSIITEIISHNKDVSLSLTSVTVKGNIVQAVISIEGSNTTLNIKV